MGGEGMVERLLLRYALFAAGGGIPPIPTAWATLQTYTASGTWTVPKDGWYRIHCIGKGGNGGNGGAPAWGPYAGGGGGGGGSGGYDAAVYYLEQGVQVPITYTTAYSQFGGPSDLWYMKAYAGTNGSAGTPGASSAPGGTRGSPGGIVTNANHIANISGKYGVAGANGGNQYVLGMGSYAAGGNGGASVVSLISTAYNGKGGNGGRGGYYNSGSSSDKVAEASGVAGNSGAVIIEEGA